MKGILTFNLPEERAEFERASNAGAWELIVWDMKMYIRDKLKYTELTDDEQRIYCEVGAKLAEIMDDHEVTFS